jgi:hypothetical protein
MRVSARLRAAVVLIAVAGLSTGCGTSDRATPGATAPRPAPMYGLTWAQIEDVERPGDAFAIPSDLPTGPPGPDTAGHPGHFPGQSILADVAVQGDRLVAVGFTFNHDAWTADAWTSTDGLHWALAPLDARPGSFAVSVAARAGGGFVAVGRVGAEPAAWTSPDGSAWTPASVARLSAGARVGEPERMATVVATDHGLVAGGSAGPELGDRRARLWRSTDGTEWAPIPDDRAFEAAEVVAIAWALDDGFVAIGRLGTGQRAVDSVALRSLDGAAWSRPISSTFEGALAAAVVHRPDGGWLAVGSDGDERQARAWFSLDGVAWTSQGRQESLLHAGEKIRMTDVLSTPQGSVAIGNFVGVQFGDGTSWLQTDGQTWTRAPLQASLGQGEPEAIVAWRDRLVMVGSRGAPDNYIPTAWVGPTAP